VLQVYCSAWRITSCYYRQDVIRGLGRELNLKPTNIENPFCLRNDNFYQDFGPMSIRVNDSDRDSGKETRGS